MFSKCGLCFPYNNNKFYLNFEMKYIIIIYKQTIMSNYNLFDVYNKTLCGAIMVDIKVYSLLKVYECGSFVAAAKQLSITQPAVSQHIKALEEELNIRIFERSNGKLVVTQQGEEVINCARKMVGLYNNLSQNLSDSKNMLTRLTVGVTHTVESSPIAEALAKYCAETQNANIKIITNIISNLYSMLKTYELDLAIVEGRISDPQIRYLPLDTDYLVLAVSPTHPFAKKNMVTLNELKKEQLILRLPDSGTRNLFVAHLESNNMSINDFNVLLEVDNMATIKDLIRRDFGVSILAKSVCLDEIKKGKIITLPIENMSMMREINIAYHADFTQFDILNQIVKIYNETLRLYK